MPRATCAAGRGQSVRAKRWATTTTVCACLAQRRLLCIFYLGQGVHGCCCGAAPGQATRLAGGPSLCLFRKEAPELASGRQTCAHRCAARSCIALASRKRQRLLCSSPLTLPGPIIPGWQALYTLVPLMQVHARDAQRVALPGAHQRSRRRRPRRSEAHIYCRGIARVGARRARGAHRRRRLPVLHRGRAR